MDGVPPHMSMFPIPACSSSNMPIPNCSQLPGTAGPSPTLDMEALASIFAVVRPNHVANSTTKRSRNGNNPPKPRPVGRRLHHLLMNGPCIWDFRSYELLKDHLACNPEDTLFAVLTRSRLVVGSRLCHKCGRAMQLRSRLANQRNTASIEWRCRMSKQGRKVDCSTQSFRNGSVFASSKVDLNKHVEALFGWLEHFEWNSIVDQKGELRSALNRLILREPALGGPNIIVDALMVTIPDGSQVLLLCESVPNGRLAATLAVNLATNFAIFLRRWLHPGSKIAVAESDYGLRDLFTPLLSMYTLLPPNESNCSQYSHVAEARSQLISLAVRRKAFDETVAAECILRFNYRSNLRPVFWNLFTVPNVAGISDATTQ